jgi:hypothetical protein
MVCTFVLRQRGKDPDPDFGNNYFLDIGGPACRRGFFFYLAMDLRKQYPPPLVYRGLQILHTNFSILPMVFGGGGRFCRILHCPRIFHLSPRKASLNICSCASLDPYYHTGHMMERPLPCFYVWTAPQQNIDAICYGSLLAPLSNGGSQVYGRSA